MLNNILNNQKTVTTAKLRPIVEKLLDINTTQSSIIQSNKETIMRLNRKCSHQHNKIQKLQEKNLKLSQGHNIRIKNTSYNEG